MHRLLVLVAGLVVALGVGAIVTAQDATTPATTDVTACASPVAGSPVASPAGAAMATPIATPEACPAEAATTITIDMVDVAFLPAEITIPANTDVTIELPNKGGIVHNFTVDELSIKSDDAASGQTTTVTINAAAGTYEFYCAIPGHREAGMVGTLVVQ